MLQYVDECQCMEAACEGWSRELLSRAVLRAWVRAAATARREGWEREREAKMHHVRSASRGCRFYCVGVGVGGWGGGGGERGGGI